jgi:hypothetical protein
MEDKTYQTPEIVYEGELEVQAGTPFGLPSDLDPLGQGSDD